MVFSWLIAQTIFIVAASKRSDPVWFSLSGRGLDFCRDRGDASVNGRDSSLLGFYPSTGPRVLPLS